MSDGEATKLNQPRVWGIGTPRTLRAHWILEELALPYSTEAIQTRTEAMDSAAFRAISPRGKIPMLEDGETTLGESAAIALYLADTYRERSALAPEPGCVARALHDELCFFAMTEMDALLYTLRRHEGLPAVYGASETACAAARAYFSRSSGEIERRLADGRAALLGPDFTVADALVTSCLTWARVVQIELTPRLLEYEARILARPAAQRAMATNYPPEVMAHLLGT